MEKAVVANALNNSHMTSIQCPKVAMLRSKDMCMQRFMSNLIIREFIRNSTPAAMSKYQSVNTRLLPLLKFARPYLVLTRLGEYLC